MPLLSQYSKKRFIPVIPNSAYGPNDNFHLENSHVVPALIRKFDDAKTTGNSEVTLWGTGSPFREFIHSNDLASAVVFCLENYDSNEHLNIGTGSEISISKLANLISRIVGFDGKTTILRTIFDVEF